MQVATLCSGRAGCVPAHWHAARALLRSHSANDFSLIADGVPALWLAIPVGVALGLVSQLCARAVGAAAWFWCVLAASHSQGT